jgi:hypothetical protein
MEEKIVNRLATTFMACVVLLLSVTFVAAQEDATPKKRKFYHDKDIATEYDKDKNETKVELRRSPVRVSNFPGEPVLNFTAYFVYPGKTPSKPQDVVIGFVSESRRKEKKFADARELMADIGGKMESFGTAELVDSRNLTYSLKEVLGIYIPYEKFLHIVNVDEKKDTLKMSIGNIRFELDKKQLEALRDLASRTNP